ncbi:hypothetical protein ACFCX0_38170 [Streptomyces sp. NPDC056352]|uniref:hypothetical protein n=1 Tax=Streptomyces sp. NPDC056352 TaxID=3345791 RepID=UPI0035DF2B65
MNHIRRLATMLSNMPARLQTAIARGARPAPTRRPPRAPVLFFATPQLCALLALNLVVAAGSAMVTVNSVVYVRDQLGRSATDASLAVGAYGGGSMIVALILPRVLDRVSDRAVMLRGALLLTLVFAALGAVTAAGSGGWQ